MADDIYSLADAYNSGGFGLSAPGQSTPQPGPQPSATPQGSNVDALLAMLQKSQPAPEPVYAPQLQEALGRHKSNEEAFNQMIKAAMERKDEQGPSKAEMYFRLAAAFGTPTKTGFFENLGQAGQAAAGVLKEQREATAGERDKLLNLGMMQRKMSLESSKDEVSNLRQLVGAEKADNRALSTAEAADKRAIALEAYKSFLQSGKPQSEGGKYAADLGLKPGTPEFAKATEKYIQSKMESGDYFKQAMLAIQAGNLAVAKQGADNQNIRTKIAEEASTKLSPTLIKLKSETEDAVANVRSGIGMLDKIYDLGKNAYDSSVPDLVEYTVKSIAGSKDPKVVNTSVMRNLMTQEGLAGLKAAFGGAPTEGERKIILEIQGIGAKSAEERNKVIMNARRALMAKEQRELTRLHEINSNKYTQTTLGLSE